MHPTNQDDVHAHLGLAAEALERIEAERGRSVAQVFSVGDLGLFVEEADWRWLTGSEKHRHPDWSAATARAWSSCAGVVDHRRQA